MKLKRFLGFMSLTAVLLTFTACSDDDDDNGAFVEPSIEIPLSSYVVGTYTCDVEMAFAYGTQEYKGKTITITANSDDANYVDISFTDDELGTLNGATGIEVVDNNNGSFSLTELECVLAMPTHSGGTSDYTCLVSGTISEDHQAFSIVFNVPSVMGGTTYTFTPANDDDNEIPLSSYVVGTYTCDVEMAFAYGTQEYEGKTITITANSADANSVDISFTDDELGTLNGATGIEVVDNNNGSFSLTELECVLAMPTHSGGTSDYACLVSGTISEDHQAFSIVFNVPAVMGGTTYTFTPANDDDNEIPLSSYVVGTYTCNVEMAFAYGTQEYEGKTITITANSADANSVDISFTDDELGTLNGATGIEVVDNNNGSFSLTELECVLAMPNHSGGTSDYACLVSGTISEDHQAFSIVFNVPAVMGGTTYTFTPAN